MISIKEYKVADSLEEAYILNQKRGNIIIGGMGWAKMQKKNVHTAIDLSNLGLDQITEDEKSFKIGAMVTLRQLETHKDILNFFGEGIKESLRHIVGVQFRNCATVGGSVRMKFGFSDVITALMALDAQVKTYKQGVLSLEDYAKMPYDRDIVINIILNKDNKKMAYQSLRNSYSDIPVSTVAVTKDNKGYSAVVGARPMRAEKIYDTEKILTGEITKEKSKQFASFVANRLIFGTNPRATKAYRKHLAKVLIQRCVTALEEGGETENGN